MLTDKQKAMILASDRWPVTMVTERERDSISYEVVCGNVTAGDHGDARSVWCETVHFGATDATVAGGSDFVQAARHQQQIADEVLAFLHETEG